MLQASPRWPQILGTFLRSGCRPVPQPENKQLSPYVRYPMRESKPSLLHTHQTLHVTTRTPVKPPRRAHTPLSTLLMYRRLGAPQACTGLKEYGHTFATPLFGTPQRNDLKNLYVQARSLRLAAELEQHRGRRYAYIAWSRVELEWIAPHPPLHHLAAQPECVWVPLGEDYAGLNDRHGIMAREHATAYFGRWDGLIDGSICDAHPCFNRTNSTLCGQTNERYLSLHLAYHQKAVCRFPPTGFLSCCDRSRSCNK
eukprot:5630534-Prymnesium_polylepis.1